MQYREFDTYHIRAYKSQSEEFFQVKFEFCKCNSKSNLNYMNTIWSNQKFERSPCIEFSIRCKREVEESNDTHGTHG